MDVTPANLFRNIPSELKNELTDILLKGKDVRVERIVSSGHASPPGFWYDQTDNELVILLKGSAGLMFEGSDKAMTMNAGDYVNIPSHLRHRVAWTAPDEYTVWLAIFYNNND